MKTTIKIFMLLAFATLLLSSCSEKKAHILKKQKVEFSPAKPSGSDFDAIRRYVTAKSLTLKTTIKTKTS